MKKPGFWKADWFLGLVVVLVMMVASRGDLIQSLERKAYDLGVKAASRTPSDRIAIIAIDDASIANIGRWPWSRDVQARMIELLTKAKAKVIANTTFFFESQRDAGLVYVDRLSSLQKELLAAAAADPQRKAEMESQERMGSLLGDAEKALNTDRALAASIKAAGNQLLPMVFQQLAEPRGNPDKPIPPFVLPHTVAMPKNVDVFPPSGLLPLYPIAELGEAAAGIGHLNGDVDVDGALRSEPLLIRHFDRALPSLSVMIAAKSLNLGMPEIRPEWGEALRLGRLRIQTDPELRMQTFFYADRDGRPPFSVDSFFDVLNGKVPASKFQDKIVLIGATAAGVGASQVTPISPASAPVFTLAHTVSSILGEHFFVVPSWGGLVQFIVFLLVAAYLIALLPRLRAGLAAWVSLGIGLVLVATHFGLMVSQLMWLQLMSSVMLLAVGYAALTTKRFLVTERGKEQSDAESAESNRMLGIAYQAQGQLDLAWDKFRQVPLSDPVMENLYSLALDFERKRQFNKAEAVFQYMAGFNPKFRDLEEKLTRAKALSETVILGGAQGHPGGTVMLSGGGMEKPMLGRYQVEKELGKGAMGVVYLGKDPKIGRVVAIKTMALSQEFEGDELTEVKERFFREAETAGRLTHPHIVTIYDAGEEHDLAYIAMEFLKGRDLAPHTKPDALLPVTQVLSIVARVAEALGYAHQHNVVHRDIKPANIMYEAESDTVKVTDFGIARVTDSSKTKTGMVLGTPSYMSPEQLSGQKVEGRSDLFSLGVMLYQMLAGRLPFQGDSMAQLMFKIANEAHADIRTQREGLPACVAAVTNKALAKDPAQRYQSGDQMAKAIRLCLGTLTAAKAPANKVS